MDQKKYLNTSLSHEKITVPILKNFKEGIVIFDIGSCDGLDSLRYNSIFPDSTIHAFEADEANFCLLKENVNKFENIVTRNLALSNTSKRLTFFNSSSVASDNQLWNNGNKSGSLLTPKEHLKIFSEIKFPSTSQVTAITLNDYCQTNQISRIHLMHIDVQGAEMMVLEGGSNILKNTVFIWLEASNVELYENQPLKAELIEFLKSNKFNCILDKVGKRPYGDLLFFNKDFKSLLPKKHYLLIYTSKLLSDLLS